MGNFAENLNLGNRFRPPPALHYDVNIPTDVATRDSLSKISFSKNSCDPILTFDMKLYCHVMLTNHTNPDINHMAQHVSPWGTETWQRWETLH